MTQMLEPSSFRDPSGFIFFENDRIYRQINQKYQSEYQHLMNSGLYECLEKEGLMVPHRECDTVSSLTASKPFRVIEPQSVPVIIYPYEWSFEQLRQAALLTLDICVRALKFDMILKDASAYNVLMQQGSLVFIDTLSFDHYKEGQPWDAYRQFCQHFLAPLLLAAKVDLRMIQELRQYIDGYPLDLASKLLPTSSWLSLGTLSHIHAHARAQARYSPTGGNDTGASRSSRSIPRRNLLGLLDSLKSLIKDLKIDQRSEWDDYYNDTNYEGESFTAKEKTILNLVNLVKVKKPKVLDIGSNNGHFSRVLAAKAEFVVSADIDPNAVNYNFKKNQELEITNIYPAVLDLTNPSPDIGWHNQERRSFTSRSQVDVVMALALIHHICIANNVPLERSAAFFTDFAEHLILEFVPKEDSQCQRLLSAREDIFTDYHLEGFEAAYCRYYDIIEKQAIPESKRTLYLLKRRSH